MSSLKEKVSPFAAGCIVTAGILVSHGAIGTSGIEPKTEQVINKVVSDTTQAVLQSLEQREQERLDALPDPLDCNSFSWMESCEELNRQAKQNPTAPLRVKNKEGLEFNFPPGTSSSMMSHLLNGTEESTRALVEDLDNRMKHHTEAAERYNQVLWARGGFDSVETSSDVAFLNQSKPRDTIATEKVAISVFYDTRCSACKVSLNNLKFLKERYPDLQISAFQMDQTEGGPARIKEKYGIPARIVSASEIEKLRQQGVEAVPTMWIDNRVEKKRMTRQGPVSLTVIENELERVSLYQQGGRG